jgi:hypothetical protein
MIRSVCGCENAKEKKKFLSNKRTEKKEHKRKKEKKWNLMQSDETRIWIDKLIIKQHWSMKYNTWAMKQISMKLKTWPRKNRKLKKLWTVNQKVQNNETVKQRFENYKTEICKP